MESRSDIELLELIGRDDQKALEELYSRYYYRLCDYAFQYVRSIDLTEEVVSDVFLKIWKSRQTIRVTGSFKAYLYTATRNQSISYIKRERHDWESLDALTLTATDILPDEAVMMRELETRIERLVEILPPRRKMIFKLSRFEGLTYREISDVLSISIHTVQNQMVKAVKQLAMLLELNDDHANHLREMK
jgi:RNA polymerase sigma-70 factor, ECF subfamily